MKTLTTIFVSVLLITACYSQEEPEVKPRSEMNQVEKDVVMFINEVRAHPKEFCDKYIRNNKNISKDRYYKTLVQMLDTIKPLKEILVDNHLNATTQHHGANIGKYGITAHVYSDGRSIIDVFNVDECCNFGATTGLDIVLDQLIDRGNSDYGHRMAILDNNFSKIGVYFGKHNSNYKTCTVIHYL